jgi:hypothetical protein
MTFEFDEIKGKTAIFMTVETAKAVGMDAFILQDDDGKETELNVEIGSIFRYRGNVIMIMDWMGYIILGGKYIGRIGIQNPKEKHEQLEDRLPYKPPVTH